MTNAAGPNLDISIRVHVIGKELSQRVDRSPRAGYLPLSVPKGVIWDFEGHGIGLARSVLDPQIDPQRRYFAVGHRAEFSVFFFKLSYQLWHQATFLPSGIVLI